MPQPARSVRIGENERGGWTSERPRRPGEPERPPRQADVSARCRVLAPTDRIRYSPGSLVLVVGADHQAVEAFAAKVVEERGALLSRGRIRELLAGKVGPDEIDAKADALIEAAATKRMAAGDSVVVPLEGLDAETRDRWVRIAAPHRRPRHLILVEPGKDKVAEEDRETLRELRSALDAGALGEEGFYTAMRLGGQALAGVKKVIFAPPPSDD